MHEAVLEGERYHGENSRIKLARVLFEHPAVLQKSRGVGRRSKKSQLSRNRQLPFIQHQHSKRSRKEAQ